MKRAWIYLNNPFEIATRNSKAKMRYLANDHASRLEAAKDEPGLGTPQNSPRKGWMARLDGNRSALFLLGGIHMEVGKRGQNGVEPTHTKDLLGHGNSMTAGIYTRITKKVGTDRKVH